MRASLAGRTLGNYRVQRAIGQGGMGIVYVGEHVLIGRKVAIKVLLPAVSGDPASVRRFFNEARASARIRHPGIVDVLDFGTHSDGTAYLVMEFLEGENLRQRLMRVGALPEATARRLGRQVAGALAAAHARQIIHRDLKPDNLFIVSDDNVIGGERAKVLDFGVAKLIGQPVHSAVATRSGAIVGSPAYAAPEQARGHGAIDERTDVYALGCVLFEMTCGRRPFTAQGFAEVLAMHMFQPPPSPREIVPGISSDFDALILRMLAKEPAERPASMEDVAAALGEASAAGLGEASAALSDLAATVDATQPPPGMAAILTPQGGSSVEERSVARRGRRYAATAAACVVAAAAALALVWQSRIATERTIGPGVEPSPSGAVTGVDRTSPVHADVASLPPPPAATAASLPDAGLVHLPDASAAPPRRRTRTERRAPRPRPRVERGQVIDE